MQPGIGYAFSRLASFSRNPNKPAFIALEHFIQYLHSHKHEPIFYPARLAHGHQNIQYKFSPKQCDEYQLPASPVFFSDVSFGNILPQR